MVYFSFICLLKLISYNSKLQNHMCDWKPKKFQFCFVKILNQAFLHYSHIWLWGFFTFLVALAHGVPRSIRLVLHYRAGGSGVLAWVAIAPPPPDFGRFISKPVPLDDLLTTVCPCPSPKNFKTFPRLWLYDMELCQGTIENKVCWTTNRQFLKGHQESEQCKIFFN